MTIQLVSPLGPLALEQSQIRRLGGGKLAVTATYESTGTHVLLDGAALGYPTLGDTVQLLWVSIQPAPSLVVDNLAQVRLIDGAGTREIYNAYFVGHWEPFDMASDGQIHVVTENDGKIAVTMHFHVIDSTP